MLLSFSRSPSPSIAQPEARSSQPSSRTGGGSDGSGTGARLSRCAHITRTNASRERERDAAATGCRASGNRCRHLAPRHTPVPPPTHPVAVGRECCCRRCCLVSPQSLFPLSRERETSCVSDFIHAFAPTFPFRFLFLCFFLYCSSRLPSCRTERHVCVSCLCRVWCVPSHQESERERAACVYECRWVSLMKQWQQERLCVSGCVYGGAWVGSQTVSSSFSVLCVCVLPNK